ncbi:MAG: UDP-galactopyranose mutase [Sporolactobacillus sp.]
MTNRLEILMKYDYLIVGAGLFGSTFAFEAAKRGKRVKVIDRRNHIAGNIYTEKIEGINVHKYGAHIFHTNSKKIWEYVNQFAEFNRYTNSPIANYKGEIYNLPFNMNTFNKLWGVVTPEQAKQKIEQQKKQIKITNPKNLEEQAISLIGTDVYEKLVKGYTEKQWGRKATELPAFIIKRLPVRFTYDNNYFNDTYQGIPMGGYTQIIEKMLDNKNITVELNQDFFEKKEQYMKEYPKIIFTGMIDQFFDYQFGTLEYRSLRFESETLDTENYQGNAVVNYTDAETPYTRVIEHKHFEFGNQPKTIITREYPSNWKKGDEPYYPMNDEKNNELYRRYKELAEEVPNIIFGGRLGMYKYYDMHQVIAAALETVNREFN